MRATPPEFSTETVAETILPSPCRTHEVMLMQRLRYLGLLLLVLLVSATPVLAQQPNPLGLQPTPIVEPLSVQLWMDRSTYMEGETAQIMFSVNQPAYVYILNIQSDGIVRLVFPNAYSQSNFVSPGVHTLPDGLYEFLITPPAGTDHLQIVASTAPLQLPVGSAGEPYPMIGADPNAALEAIQVQIQGITTEPICNPPWATAWCSFTIIAAPQTQPPCTCEPPTYTPPVYTPPVCTPPVYSPPVCEPPTYTPPACTIPTYTPPTYTIPTYTPPTCTIPTYTPPTHICPPVTNPCQPVLPFFGGLFRIGFGFRIQFGIDCDD